MYQRLYYYKAKDSPEHVEAILLEKKQEREEQKKLEENTSDEPPMKDMRKYKKDLNDAYIIV